MSLKQSKSTKCSRKQVNNYLSVQPQSVLEAIKDDQAVEMVMDYLSCHGYSRSLEALKLDRNRVKRTSNSEVDKLMTLLDSNNRVEFFSKIRKDLSKEVREHDQTYKKLEFYLHIYFLVTTKRDRVFQAGAIQAFKSYLQAKGKYISDTKEYLPYFALPYIPEPASHPAISHIFKKEWLANIRSQLFEFLSQTLKQTHLSMIELMIQKSNKKGVEDTASFHLSNQRENQLLESIQKSNQHYKELQANYREMIQATKQNLIQSQAKWFSLSKELIQICKKFMRVVENNNLMTGNMISMSQKIKKYEVFLNNNVDDMISNSCSVSVFDQPTYEDMYSQSISRNIIKQRSVLSVLSLNYEKIKHNLLEEPETNLCLLLQALRWRVTKNPSAYGRREIIMGYTVSDILSLKLQSAPLLQRLLDTDTSEAVKEQALRLINTIESDYYGRTYMLENNKLLQKLVLTLKSESYDGTIRRLTLNALQKLSLRPQAQLYTIQHGIIHWIVQTIKLQKDQLSEVSFQYLTALLMNMTLKKAGQEKCEKEQILQLLIELLEMDSDEIRTYVSGSIYSLMSSHRIREEAKRIAMLEQLRKYIQNPQSNQFSKQISYIIDEMEKKEAEPFEEFHTDQEEENDVDDIDQQEEDDHDEQFDDQVLGAQRMDKGEQLLLKKYSCVGPDAIRQEYLTRSILDEAITKNSLDMSMIKRSSKGDRVSNPARSGTIQMIQAIQQRRMKENALQPSILIQQEKNYDSNNYLPKYQSFRKKNLSRNNTPSEESIKSPKISKP